MSDDPRFFRPEEEQQRLIDGVNAGLIDHEGNPIRQDRAPASVTGGLGAGGILLLVPAAMVITAAFVWFGGFAGYAPLFRGILESLLPDSWVATTPDGPAHPLMVGVILGAIALVILAALLLTRRLVRRIWTNAASGAAALSGLGYFALSAIIVLLLILTPGFVFIGISISVGADIGSAPVPEGATIRVWPLILTVTPMAWFAIRATWRAARMRSIQLRR